MKSTNAETKKRRVEDQPLSSYPYIACRVGFNNLHEVAEHFQIDYNELVEEVKNSKCVHKKIITGSVRKLLQEKHEKEVMKRNGGKAKTVQELHEITGFPKGTIQKRRRRGMTDEEIINTPIRNKKKQKFSVEGKTYYSADELATAYGMSYQTIQKRADSGMTSEEIVFTPIRERNRKGVFLLGKEYAKMGDACHEHRVCETSVYCYKSQHKNLSMEDIILRKASGPAFAYTVYGENYPSIKAVAAAYKVDPTKLYNRIYSGKYDYIEDAIEALKQPQPKKKAKKAKKGKYRVLGKWYKSHREIWEEFNISEPNYNYHLYKLKESPEEIIKYFQEKEVIA